jgi:hypothetical protein
MPCLWTSFREINISGELLLTYKYWILQRLFDVSILYNNFLKQFTNRQKYDFMRSIAYIHEQTHIPTFMHSMHAYLLTYLLTYLLASLIYFSFVDLTLSLGLT